MGNPNHDDLGRFADGPGGGMAHENGHAATGDRTTDNAIKMRHEDIVEAADAEYEAKMTVANQEYEKAAMDRRAESAAYEKFRSEQAALRRAYNEKTGPENAKRHFQL